MCPVVVGPATRSRFIVRIAGRDTPATRCRFAHACERHFPCRGPATLNRVTLLVRIGMERAPATSCRLKAHLSRRSSDPESLHISCSKFQDTPATRCRFEEACERHVLSSAQRPGVASFIFRASPGHTSDSLSLRTCTWKKGISLVVVGPTTRSRFTCLVHTAMTHQRHAVVPHMHANRNCLVVDGPAT